MALVKSIAGNEICDTVARNAQVGGRNLLSDSKFNKTSRSPVNNWIEVGSTNSSSYTYTTDGLKTTIPSGSSNFGGTIYLIHVDRIPLEYEKYITISLDFKYVSGTLSGFNCYSNSSSSANWWMRGLNSVTLGLTEAVSNPNVWTRVSTTFKIPKANEMYANDRIIGARIQMSDKTEYWTKNVKIERGDKATDWTPAPEDALTMTDDNNGNVTISIL